MCPKKALYMAIRKVKHTSIKLLILFFTVIYLYSCEKCMRCQYYYKDGTKYKLYKHTECGNDEELQLFKESMEYAAEQFDTTTSCVPY